MNPHILMAIAAELDAAKEKHPVWPTDNVKRASILIEEAGEVIREANLLDEGKGSLQSLRAEIIQSTAMGIRFLEEMDDNIESDRHYTNNL